MLKYIFTHLCPILTADWATMSQTERKCKYFQFYPMYSDWLRLSKNEESQGVYPNCTRSLWLSTGPAEIKALSDFSERYVCRISCLLYFTCEQEQYQSCRPDRRLPSPINLTPMQPWGLFHNGSRNNFFLCNFFWYEYKNIKCSWACCTLLFLLVTTHVFLMLHSAMQKSWVQFCLETFEYTQYLHRNCSLPIQTFTLGRTQWWTPVTFSAAWSLKAFIGILQIFKAVPTDGSVSLLYSGFHRIYI